MSDRLRRIIGGWQIACGAIGLVLFACLASNVIPDGRAYIAREFGVINLGLGTVYFAVVAAAGLGLLRRAPWAVPTSLVCQVVQVVSFAVLGGPHVAIAAGPSIGLTLASDRVNLAAGFNSTFFIGTRVAGTSWEVTINLLALAWVIVLARDTEPEPSAIEPEAPAA